MGGGCIVGLDTAPLGALHLGIAGARTAPLVLGGAVVMAVAVMSAVGLSPAWGHVPSCATDPQLSPLCPVQVAQHPHGLPIPALPLAGHWPHSCRGGAFAPLNLSLQRAFLCWVLGSPRTAYTHPSRPGPLCLAVAPQPGWDDCRLRLQGGISALCHASNPRHSPWGGERRVNPELRGAVRWFDQIALSLLCLSH